MKAMIVLILISLSLHSFALTRSEAKQLLREKNISLEMLEASGAQIKLGEVTGAGFIQPIEKIEIILLKDEAILRNELQSTTFNPATGQIRHLDSFHAQGAFFERKEIQGIIHR